jgi:hypothetical protein
MRNQTKKNSKSQLGAMITSATGAIKTDKARSAFALQRAHHTRLLGNTLHFFTNTFDILAHAVDGVASRQKYTCGNHCQNQNLVHIVSPFL